MPSLFGRMSRYPPRLRFNATENQHTEALAAVLEADRGVARALAAGWLELQPTEMPDDIRVRTQAPATGLDRVDLELRFGPIGRPDRIIWVEIKVDAPLSGDDQLKQYWKALFKEPANRVCSSYFSAGMRRLR